MGKYIIHSDFEKQKLLKDIEEEGQRLNKSKYWILKQMSIPSSTYYDWVKTGGITKSKAPNTVWNKSTPDVEDEILRCRDDVSAYRSQRSPNGISTKLEEKGIIMTSVGVWNVLKRYGKNREFVEDKDTYIIFPKSDKFLDVVCIDDIALTNKKPRDLAIFNAVDEYSQELVAISFVPHKVNRHDVLNLLEMVFKEYQKYPTTVRLDNAKAHGSLKVKEFCKQKGIKLQFIDKGIPQQNWPVETFNGVIKKDLLKTNVWKWNASSDENQETLKEYQFYYNTQKRLDSDPLKRTPREISTAITSQGTQNRLKLKLLRKHKGQVIARQYMLSLANISLNNLSEMCVN